jgi:hypothetical protein
MSQSQSRSHFTHARTVRKVDPYRFLWDRDRDRGQGNDQDRERQAGPNPPLTLAIDGRSYGVSVGFLAGPPAGHVVELVERDGRDRCHVMAHPEHGLVGTCAGWTADGGCVHGDACYEAGLFPELETACLSLGERAWPGAEGGAR